jgi:hypothetical protein
MKKMEGGGSHHLPLINALKIKRLSFKNIIKIYNDAKNSTQSQNPSAAQHEIVNLSPYALDLFLILGSFLRCLLHNNFPD